VGLPSDASLELRGVGRAHDVEVPVVGRCDGGDLAAFGDDDQARVGAAEGKVGVGLDQLGDPLGVGGCERLDLDPARRYRARKNAASAGAPSCRR
jgi:hypothetical protein